MFLALNLFLFFLCYNPNHLLNSNSHANRSLLVHVWRLDSTSTACECISFAAVVNSVAAQHQHQRVLNAIAQLIPPHRLQLAQNTHLYVNNRTLSFHEFRFKFWTFAWFALEHTAHSWTKFHMSHVRFFTSFNNNFSYKPQGSLSTLLNVVGVWDLLCICSELIPFIY